MEYCEVHCTLYSMSVVVRRTVCPLCAVDSRLYEYTIFKICAYEVKLKEKKGIKSDALVDKSILM